MYQRSSTYVLSATNGWNVIMKGKSVSSLNQRFDVYVQLGLYDGTGPPTDIADKINASFPSLLKEYVGARQVDAIEELDK